MEQFLNSRQDEMLGLLEQLVNIDSGSRNKAGIDKVGSILKEAYINLGFDVQTVRQDVQGDHLIIRHNEAKHPEILIVAHMDTVFRDGTAKERPFSVRDGRAFGPGVIDMKASLVSLLYAVRAISDSGRPGLDNIEILLTSDEEIGSITSRPMIEAHAAGKKAALIMEPARKDGSLVSARKGGGDYTIRVHGVAAHSGIEPEKGRSATEELAHKIIKLHELTDYNEGITVNVGIIQGGDAVNVVTPEAVGYVDIRTTKLSQAEPLDQKIREICAVPDVEGTKITVEGTIDRPPMERTEGTAGLIELIKEIGSGLGIEVTDTSTGGGGDASYTSAAGIPTIDGMGPVGGNAHRDDEYMEVDSFIPRCILLAETIARLSEKP
ncbi:carboxypeptidase [Bhargavaea cecembensis]|uniref:Carboxypeptidase n=1 Tax=Bhargavaea cecembensis TaxID=394098 RepID=A0A161SSP6_9BACL|nr:M20 family metallopeptidase [Bhargavaea cecembensis]KZE38570.1 carboxypeptidase [Bhargavaea cecembensis]